MSLIKKLMLAFLWLPTMSMAVEPIVINENIKRMAEKASKINMTPEMLERVESLVKHIESDQYRDEMKGMRAAAESVVDIDGNPLVTENMKKKMKPQSITGDRLYVFISSSVPKRTLRNYVRDIAKLKNAVLVLRGFVGGASHVKPTARFVIDILKKEEHCEAAECDMWNVEVQIDPILFKRYNIQRVPAVAFAEDIHFDGYCRVKEEDLNKQIHDLVVYGDAALSYVINYMYEETGQSGLNILAQRLEPKSWEHL